MPTNLHISTIYSPGLNPIGGISIIACLTVLLSILTTTDNVFLPISKQSKERWIMIWPILFFVALLLNQALVFPAYRRFADMPDFLADIFALAFGTGYALVNIRQQSKINRIMGLIYAIIYFLAVTSLLAMMNSHFDWIPESLSGVCWLATAFIWIYLLYWQNKKYPLFKTIDNLCDTCGYDLRGSSGQPTCPECGSEIIKAIKPINTSSAEA